MARPTPTPIPFRKIGILGLILTANNMSIWMIFSFLPFMVSDFFPGLSRSELGYKAGILGSAFSVGGLIGNLFWGTFSDKFGRRPALLAGLFGTALSSLCFGFAPSFWFAVSARFLWGLLNGNIGVAKTYLSEISDDSNSAKGMALFGVIGGVGRMIGPIVGGFLSSPAKVYPNVFRHTIFEVFPYALPSLIVCINCIIVLIIAYFELNETLPAKLQNRLEMAVAPHQKFGDDKCTNAHNSKAIHRLATAIKELEVSTTFERESEAAAATGSSGRYTRLRTSEDTEQESAVVDIESGCERDDPDTSMQSDQLLVGRAEADVPGVELWSMAPKTDRKRRPRLSFSSVVEMRTIGSSARAFSPLKQVSADETPLVKKETSSPPSFSNNSNNDAPDGTLTSLQYSNGSEFNESRLSSMQSIGGNLWYLLTRREVFLTSLLYGMNALTLIVLTEIFPLWVVTAEGAGGFGYDASAIGMSTMICGLVAIFAQVVVYPLLVDRYGVLQVYRLGTLLFGAGCAVMPMVSVTTALGSRALTWVAVVFMSAVVNIASSWVLICVFVLINNSCYSHQRASVNGIGQTFASLGRICGPYLGAVAFAWSETNGLGWPLNFYFVWYLLALFAAINFSLVFLLPRSIERRRREPKYAAFCGNHEMDSRMAQLALETSAVRAASVSAADINNLDSVEASSSISGGSMTKAVPIAQSPLAETGSPSSLPLLPASASPTDSYSLVRLLEDDREEGGGKGNA